MLIFPSQKQAWSSWCGSGLRHRSWTDKSPILTYAWQYVSAFQLKVGPSAVFAEQNGRDRLLYVWQSDKVAIIYLSKMQISIHFQNSLKMWVGFWLSHVRLIQGQFVMTTNILPTVDEDKLHEMIEANPDFCLTLFNSIPVTFLLQHRL